MKEPKPINLTRSEELRERRRVRLVELEPRLQEFAGKAKAAYDTLRPKARYVATVPRDYPLRFQVVQGMVPSGAEGIVADYLMIALSQNHDLILYKNYEAEEDFHWRFDRSVPLEDLLQERTRIRELVLPRVSLDGNGFMDIEVENYSYLETVGTNAKYEGSPCNDVNEFKDAETFIQDFGADLDDEVARFA